VIGKTVALNLVIGRSDKAALWIPALTGFADGFEFEIELRHDLEDGGSPFYFGNHPHRRRWASEGGRYPELIRFGIQFSDGRKATNIEGRTPGADEASEAAELSAHRGGGGGGRWCQEFSVRPLPPAGPLAFVCEWPVADIPETRNEIDLALVRDAAAEAVLLWPAAETRGDTARWATHGTGVVRPQESPEPPHPAA